MVLQYVIIYVKVGYFTICKTEALSLRKVH